VLVVISPAKKLNWDPVDLRNVTAPIFEHKAYELSQIAKDLNQQELSDLMGISANLAKLNHDRFNSFTNNASDRNTRPAAIAFAGDTYSGLEAKTLDLDSSRYAQDHLRILSGLYGLLRPFDLIQPYRLEMGSKLKTKKGNSLYEYWGDTISNELNNQAKKVNSTILLNCASNEYFSAVDRKKLKLKVINPVFLENKDGKAKIISFFAKKARGAMARFVVEQRVNDVTGIKDFDSGGYKFQPKESTNDKMVFLRNHTT